MVSIQKGKSIFDCPTCNINGCAYYEESRCIYNIATIQIRTSRACYYEERQAEIEAELDFME